MFFPYLAIKYFCSPQVSAHNRSHNRILLLAEATPVPQEQIPQAPLKFDEQIVTLESSMCVFLLSLSLSLY